MLRAPRTSQKAAKASWMKPPTRRTRCDQATVGGQLGTGWRLYGAVMSRSFGSGTRRPCR